MAAAPANPDDFRMSFGDHLEELRSRLIKALVGVLLTAAVTLYYGKDIIGWLAEPLNRAQIAAGLPPLTVTPTVTAGFFIYVKISLIGALVVASPWVLYQMWKFVEAGLYTHERKVIYILAPFSTAMMLLAVAFMYYIMLPVTLAFLMFFAVSFGPTGGQSKDPFDFLSKFVSKSAGSRPDETGAAAKDGELSPEAPVVVNPPSDPQQGFRIPEVEADPPTPYPGQVWVNSKENALKVRVGDRTLVAYLAVSSLVSPLIDLQQYIDFVLFMTLGITIAFQMPVVMLIIGWTGIAQASMLGRYRKHMFFVCFCLGAILTPSSDPLSMTLMAMPLYLLFELGLVVMRFTQRTPGADDDDDDDDDNEEEDDEEEDEAQPATA